MSGNENPPNGNEPPGGNEPPANGSGGENPPAAPKPGEEVNWENEAKKWKALSRQNEAAAKKLQAIEDSQKSELQKAQDRINELEKAANAANLQAMRAQVGVEKKLPAWAISRLQGSTKEELELDADAILKDLGGNGQGNGNGGGGNRENLQTLLQNSNANGRPALPDMNAFMRRQAGT